MEKGLIFIIFLLKVQANYLRQQFTIIPTDWHEETSIYSLVNMFTYPSWGSSTAIITPSPKIIFRKDAIMGSFQQQQIHFALNPNSWSFSDSQILVCSQEKINSTCVRKIQSELLNEYQIIQLDSEQPFLLIVQSKTQDQDLIFIQTDPNINICIIVFEQMFLCVMIVIIYKLRAKYKLSEMIMWQLSIISLISSMGFFRETNKGFQKQILKYKLLNMIPLITCGVGFINLFLDCLVETKQYSVKIMTTIFLLNGLVGIFLYDSCLFLLFTSFWISLSLFYRDNHKSFKINYCYKQIILITVINCRYIIYQNGYYLQKKLIFQVSMLTLLNILQYMVAYIVCRGDKNPLEVRLIKKMKDQETCPICLSGIEFEGAITPCNHYYHTKCLRQWVIHKNQCPIDRNPIKFQQEY